MKNRPQCPAAQPTRGATTGRGWCQDACRGERSPLLFMPVGAHDPWRGPRMKGLPSGAVTFLFSDVEGSTRLLARREALSS
jgi:hypothetical protein